MIRTTNSIALSFTLVASVCTSVIFLIAVSCFYHCSRDALEKEVLENAEARVQASVNRLGTRLRAIEKVTETVALSIETGSYTHQSLPVFIKQTLGANKNIHGLGAAFEPGSVLYPDRPDWPYFYREGRRLIFDPEENFQYLHQDWYQIPKELGYQVWTEPYLDPDSGDTLMVSCSSPIFTEEGTHRQVQGVVVTDVSIAYLTRLAGSIRMLQTGYSFLVSRNGTYLTHPDPSRVMNETIFSQTDVSASPKSDPDFNRNLKQISRNMLRGAPDLKVFRLDGDAAARVYCAPVPSTGWLLVVVLPEAELYAQVRSLTLAVIAIALSGIVFLTVMVYGISRTITAPLGALARATTDIAAGRFDAVLPEVQSHDEVGRLTLAFSAMIRDLQSYIHDLTETTAAKERIQSELKMATDIQNSLLPRIFPPFPDRPELDIYASMDPAKEVGGDFYDFFLVDPHHLCFLIADVADKGVPAALYMMVAKTLLKTEAQRLDTPDRILASVNAVLSADNDSCMFLTVFCALLDTRTGKMRFSNAGHNPPLLIRNGQVNDVPVNPGMVLGVMENAVYTTEAVTLEPGDIFFLYTDGITDAADPDGVLYGETRLRQILQNAACNGLEEMNRAVRADVLCHAKGALQSDDLTLIAVKYRGDDGRGTTASDRL